MNISKDKISKETEKTIFLCFHAECKYDLIVVKLSASKLPH